METVKQKHSHRSHVYCKINTYFFSSFILFYIWYFFLSCIFFFLSGRAATGNRTTKSYSADYISVTAQVTLAFLPQFSLLLFLCLLLGIPTADGGDAKKQIEKVNERERDKKERE